MCQHCSQAGCSKLVATVGTVCKLCHLAFCYTHGQAEVHGCGEAARQAARGAWLKGHGGAPGAPALRGWKRTAVKGQLHKKLEEAAAARGKASKDDDDGGKSKGKPKGKKGKEKRK